MFKRGLKTDDVMDGRNDGRMDGWKDRWTDGWTDGRRDGGIDGRRDGGTDIWTDDGRSRETEGNFLYVGAPYQLYTSLYESVRARDRSKDSFFLSFHPKSYSFTVRSMEFEIGLILLGIGLLELGIGLKIHFSCHIIHNHIHLRLGSMGWVS